MLRDVFSSRAILAGLVFFVVIVGCTQFYSWYVKRTIHNSEVICPECQQPTTQAVLDGNSDDMYHAFVTCPYLADYNGNTIACRVEYRNCRGVCPNVINHYNTGE